MSEARKYYLGVDVGSVSVDIAVLDESSAIVDAKYVRHGGRPIQVAGQLLRETVDEYGIDNFIGVAATGNAGRLVASISSRSAAKTRS